MLHLMTRWVWGNIEMRSDASVYWVLAGLSLSTIAVLCAAASVLLRI
jgi:hypothetical protein